MGIDFSSDSSQVVSGSRDGSVRVWDVATGAQAGHGSVARNLVTCLQWIPQSSSTIVQGAEDLHVRMWDTRGSMSAPVVALEGYTYFPLDLSVAQDGHTLATSSKGFNGVGGEVRVWDIRRPTEAIQEWKPEQTAQFEGHEADAVGCSWLPLSLCSELGEGSQSIVASASKDGSVKLWRVGSDAPLAVYKSKGGVAWSCMTALDDASQPAGAAAGTSPSDSQQPDDEQAHAASGTSDRAPHLVVGSHSGTIQGLRVVKQGTELALVDS